MDCYICGKPSPKDIYSRHKWEIFTKITAKDRARGLMITGLFNTDPNMFKPVSLCHDCLILALETCVKGLREELPKDEFMIY